MEKVFPVSEKTFPQVYKRDVAFLQKVTLGSSRLLMGEISVHGKIFVRYERNLFTSLLFRLAGKPPHMNRTKLFEVEMFSR